MTSFDIVAAQTPAQIARVAELFLEYQRYLDVDLCFQDFDQEVAGLPGDYVPPHGALLLAQPDQADAFGCVGLHPYADDGVAELKRLYVQSGHRGSKAGLRLTQRALDLALAAGYETVRLDTLPQLDTAIAMYRRFGFKEIDAYRFNPVEGTLYFELAMSDYRELTGKS
jgi:ribosomal protein S18 acetylase RimI-like enzyme